MTVATLTSKGQVTIPKAIRSQLQLRAGSRVDFVMNDNGVVELLPVSGDVRSLKGMLPKPKRRMSIDDMNAAIQRGATDQAE